MKTINTLLLMGIMCIFSMQAIASDGGNPIWWGSKREVVESENAQAQPSPEKEVAKKPVYVP